MTLSDFVKELESGDNVCPFLPDMSYDDPPSLDEGIVLPLTQEIYNYFFELLPPRFMNAWCFAFGEGAGRFRLFWERNGDYYGTELTDEQTARFCEITRVRRDNS